MLQEKKSHASVAMQQTPVLLHTDLHTVESSFRMITQSQDLSHLDSFCVFCYSALMSLKIKAALCAMIHMLYLQ